MSPYIAPGVDRFNPHHLWITNLVTKHYGVTLEELRSRDRRYRLTNPRQVLCYIAHKNTRQSWQGIGRLINRTHANVIHSVNVVENMIATNQEFREQLTRFANSHFLKV